MTDKSVPIPILRQGTQNAASAETIVLALARTERGMGTSLLLNFILIHLDNWSIKRSCWSIKVVQVDLGQLIYQVE